MAQYYFVTTLLPTLKIGSPPEIGSYEFDFILQQNLTGCDLAKVTILRRLTDIENIRLLLQDAQLQPNGNFDQKELEDALLNQESLPSYVFEFMENYGDTAARLKNFPQLIRKFFKEEIGRQKGFVHDFLLFEWRCRLICSILRAKALDRPIEAELALEDSEDPFVAAILEQKDEPSYHPPDEFLPLKTIFENHKENPHEMNLALLEWKFSHIDEMAGDHPFSLYRVLGYLIQLDIVERWFSLDKKKGLEFVEKLA